MHMVLSDASCRLVLFTGAWAFAIFTHLGEMMVYYFLGDGELWRFVYTLRQSALQPARPGQTDTRSDVMLRNTISRKVHHSRTFNRYGRDLLGGFFSCHPVVKTHLSGKPCSSSHGLPDFACGVQHAARQSVHFGTEGCQA